MSVTESKDVVFDLADNMVNIKSKDIPQNIKEITKRSILDILGTILAGSRLGEGCKEVVDLVKEIGGKKESTILVYGSKVPSPLAAFANAAMAHSLDYDDVHKQATVHPTLVTFPAALAVAEKIRGIKGEEFITVIALGNDLVSRIALAVNAGPRGHKMDWLMTSVAGVFGSAAVSGRLLGLDKDGIVNALAIALQLASGTHEVGFSLDNKYRGLYAAPVVLQGIIAALLVQRGITGPRNCLEGRGGLYNVHFNGLYNRDSLVNELGKRFEGGNVGFKPWPSCGHTLNHIDATVQVMRENALKATDIVEIIATVSEEHRPLCEPLELRQKPPSPLDAKWSIPWTIACAALREKVTLGDFTSDGIKDAATIELAQKVRIKFQPQQSATPYKVPPGIVEIKMESGEVFSKRVDYWHGALQNPLSKDELVSKFRDCASYSARIIPKKKILQVVDIVDNLEEIDDINLLIKQLY